MLGLHSLLCGSSAIVCRCYRVDVRNDAQQNQSLEPGASCVDSTHVRRRRHNVMETQPRARRPRSFSLPRKSVLRTRVLFHKHLCRVDTDVRLPCLPPQSKLIVSTRHTGSRRIKKPACAGLYQPSDNLESPSAGLHVEQLADKFANLRLLRTRKHTGFQLHGEAIRILRDAACVALA